MVLLRRRGEKSARCDAIFPIMKRLKYCRVKVLQTVFLVDVIQGRIRVEIVGEVEKNLGEVQRSSLRPPWRDKVNDVTYACSVHICISVLMNYDCTTRPILPFITITTKFLLKHCVKRVFDTEMNGYHCLNFTEKTF